MERVTLPIKTKIAAWWMVATGIVPLMILLLALILFIWGSLFHVFYGLPGALFGGILIAGFIFSSLPTILFFLGLFLLLKRKRWVWKVVVSTLSIGVLSWTFLFFYLLYLDVSAYGVSLVESINSLRLDIFGTFFAILVIPLTLLLLDRKNFWKITS